MAGLFANGVQQATQGTYQIGSETPSGVVDGINNIFTLANEPFPVDSLKFIINGIMLKKNLHYTLTGLTVTISDPLGVPQIGSDVMAFYTI